MDLLDKLLKTISLTNYMDEPNKKMLKELEGKTNKEKWEFFYEKTQNLINNKYHLIKSDEFFLHGLNSWNMDLCIREFSFEEENKNNLEEYLYNIMMINWYLSIDNLEVYKSYEFEDHILYMELDFITTNITVLKKKDLIEELNERYNKSYYFFQNDSKGYHYHRMKKDYDDFYKNYIEVFSEILREDGIFIRLNDFGKGEGVYYFIINDNKFCLIEIFDCM